MNASLSFGYRITNWILGQLGIKFGYVTIEGQNHVGVLKHNKRVREQLIFFLFPTPTWAGSSPRANEVPVAMTTMVTIESLAMLWHLVGPQELRREKTYLLGLLKAVVRGIPYFFLEHLLQKHGMALYEANPDVNDEFLPVVWGVGVRNELFRNPKMKVYHMSFFYRRGFTHIVNPRLLTMSPLINAQVRPKEVLLGMWRLRRFAMR